MKKQNKHVIAIVQDGSIAQELELVPGDILLTVNGQPVEDIFDYRYLMNEEFVVLEVEKANGEIWELEVEKEYEEDLGITFEKDLMDDYRSCSNHCIFCFIDQMPPGMRDTLYFKDDDSRLSFIQGNYVTLTNMSDHDIDRIIRYHLEPINISIQTMNPELRCKMLHNRFAGDALKKLQKLYDAGITMNGQIVLCKGVNDGKELDDSIRKMSAYAPVLQSVSVVPVGLTKFREGLYPMEQFQKEDALEVLEIIHSWQKKMMDQYGIHFIHASDEWYILAGKDLPLEESYDGYLQLENGVGMMRLLLDEVKEEMGNKLSQIVYEGKWFTPLREAVQAFIESTQEYVTGEVKFKLYKGNIIKAGTTSPYSLYNESLASFTTGDLYDHHDADGFITLFGLPLKVRAMKMQELEKNNNK